MMAAALAAFPAPLPYPPPHPSLLFLINLCSAINFVYGRLDFFDFDFEVECSFTTRLIETALLEKVCAFRSPLIFLLTFSSFFF